MQGHTEPTPRSVLSSLHNVLGSLESAFPSSSSDTLHPYTCHSSNVIRQRERALAEVRMLKSSLEHFRLSWMAEKSVVDSQFAKPDATGQTSRDLDSELERRKAGVARAMMDWCNHESQLLSTSSAISKLETQAAFRSRTPFVHAQTLVSPTERLQAVAVSIPLDVYLNNEDPDLGNATDQPGNVRIDTLSFGGERMAIDMDIRHPKWEAASTGRRRYQLEDGWQVAKCEVSYFPLGSEVAEPIVLPRMSEVLSAYLARYIGIVNTHQLEQLALDGSDDDDDSVLSMSFEEDNDSLALQAERTIVAFGENVAQIALLDKRMKKVEFEATSAEPVTPRPLTTEEMNAERNWFVEAEEMGHMVDGTIPETTIDAPQKALRSVFPVFQLLQDGLSPNATCCLKPLPKNHGPAITTPLPKKAAGSGQEMDVDRDENETTQFHTSGWMLEVEPELVVGQDAFSSEPSALASHAQALSGGKDITELLIPQSKSSEEISSTHRPTTPHCRTQQYTSLGDGTPGYRVSRFPLHQNPMHEHGIDTLKQALQRSLWLNRMYASCFKPAMRNIRSLPNGASKDVDTDLALLMSGGVLPRSALSVSVQRTAGCLQLSLPLPQLSGANRALEMLVIKVTPLRALASESDFDIVFQVLPRSDVPRKDLNIEIEDAKKEMLRVGCDMPRWLEWLDRLVHTK